MVHISARMHVLGETMKDGLNMCMQIYRQTIDGKPELVYEDLDEVRSPQAATTARSLVVTT